MVLFKITLREIRKRPGRAVLTLLSVVIGVASVVAVSIATTTTRRAYEAMFQSVSGRAALEVTAAGGSGFDQRVLAAVEATPGVQAAVPSIQRFTIMYLEGRRVQLIALGIDPERDRLVRDYELKEGKLFDDGEGILLNADFARRLGVKVNDEVKLLVHPWLTKMPVVGLLEPRGGSAISQGGMLFMPLAKAQYHFKARGQLDSVQIVLAESADANTVSAELSRRLPVGLSVRPPAGHSTQAEETILSTEQGLEMARELSLLVALFIIINTFFMNVGERRRQLAVMRAIGATRLQLARLVVREALLMGILGTLLGSLAGIGGAALLTRAMGQLFQTAMPELQLTVMPFVYAACFGIGVSLAGALIPAYWASRVTPLEGMSGISREETHAAPRWVAWVGWAVVIESSLGIAASIKGLLPMELAVIHSLVLLIGMVMLISAALRPLSAAVVALLQPLIRVEARLARQQILRRRLRTTFTIGVLFVASACGIGLASAVIDNVQDVKDWYQQIVVGDFFVRAMMPDMATGSSADLPEEVGDEIRRLPGIARIDTFSMVSAKAADQTVNVVARSYSDDEHTHLMIIDGDARQVRQRLFDGEVVAGSVLAQRVGLKAGDQITLETLRGPQQLRIAGVANDYLGGGLTLHMQTDVARRLVGVEGVDAYVISANRSSLRDVEAALAAICDKHGLLLQSFADIAAMIDGMMAGVVGSLWALLILGFVVAAFGVVNTLTMNVLEQTRELGLLRAVAMTRRQTRRTILAQAAIMAGIALPPGTVAGVGVAYLINLATMPVTGHPIEFTLHPLLLIGSLLASFVIVLAAAWLPAQRAARLDLVTALHYE